MNKKLNFILLLLFLNVSFTYSQTISKVFSDDKNIFMVFDDASEKRITNNLGNQQDYKEENFCPLINKNKTFICFIKNGFTKYGDMPEQLYQSSIMYFDISSRLEIYLCDAGYSKVDYLNTSFFPYSDLGVLIKIFLSPSENRIYFISVTKDLYVYTHYFDLIDKNIIFFASGELLEFLDKDNVLIKQNYYDLRGDKHSQNILFDTNGKFIRKLTD